MKKLVSFLVAIVICDIIVAQKDIPPKWINRQVLVGENCDFILTYSSGESSLHNARTSSLSDLRSKLNHTDRVSVDTKIINNSYDTYTSDERGVNIEYVQEDEGWIEISVEGLPTAITSRRIDEFYKKNDKDYYALYAVPWEDSNIDLSRLKSTSDYSSDPTTWFFSIIPGAAQMYKGSYLKGGLIMGGSVALAVGATLCSLTRQDYLAKMDNTHNASVKQQYVTKSNNLNTGMWTCVGCLAALYVYNIVDAFVAPGARRITVTPAVSPEGQYGASVTYNF